MFKSLLLFLISMRVSNAEFEYLLFPQSRWTSQAPPVIAGNGVFVTPDDSLVVSTSNDGTVMGFEASSGNPLWTYRPPPVNGVPMTCKSGITFSYTSSTPYMIYSVMDDEFSLFESRS